MASPEITRKFDHTRFYRDVMMILMRRQDTWDKLEERKILTYEQRKVLESDYQLDIFTIVSLANYCNLPTEMYTTYAVDGHELPPGYKVLKNTTQAERNWPAREGGSYYADCSYCLRTFTGEKGRVTCRFCETNKLFKQD